MSWSVLVTPRTEMTESKPRSASEEQIYLAGRCYVEQVRQWCQLLQHMQQATSIKVANARLSTCLQNGTEGLTQPYRLYVWLHVLSPAYCNTCLLLVPNTFPVFSRSRFMN